MNVNWAELLPIGRQVIVVEDDLILQMLLEEVLSEIGFASMAFDNADGALTHLISSKGACNLIIVDQGLPGGINGCEFIEMAKKHSPSIHSILTSGHVIDKQLIPASTIYLHKPYTLDQLEAAIVTVFSQ